MEKTQEAAPEQKRAQFFVACPKHLDGLLNRELAALGFPNGKRRGLGVHVDLTQEEVYRLVYTSRIASRVLRPLTRFRCEGEEQLYNSAKAMAWEHIIGPTRTFKISSRVHSAAITHSQYAGLKFKDAIVDRIREKCGERPNVDKDDPQIQLDIHLYENEATISLYYSKGVMHRRGYREHAVEAPLKENLAVAVLQYLEWDGTTPLIDPFCGSGTFLIEAALMASNTAPGYFRSEQGFEHLPDYEEEVWKRVKAEVDAKRVELPDDLIFGSDLSGKALAAARENLRHCGWEQAVTLRQADFAQAMKSPLVQEGKPITMVSNPPYGERLGTLKDSVELYERIGRNLALAFAGDATANETDLKEDTDIESIDLENGTSEVGKISKACLLVGEAALEKAMERGLGQKAAKFLSLDNGALPIKAAVYLAS